MYITVEPPTALKFTTLMGAQSGSDHSRNCRPFGNETAMTEADRVKFGQWLAAQ